MKQTDNPRIYFTFQKGIDMSPMEKELSKGLNSRGIKHFREVMFDKCINPETGKQLRYDIYIPSKNMLVEYDGKNFHTDSDVRFRDRVKDSFAKDNNILLVRLSGKSSLKIFFDKYFAGKPIQRKRDKKDKRQVQPIKPKKTQSEIRAVIERRDMERKQQVVTDKIVCANIHIPPPKKKFEIKVKCPQFK
jgi:hypothetical protein